MTATATALTVVMATMFTPHCGVVPRPTDNACVKLGPPKMGISGPESTTGKMVILVPIIIVGISGSHCHRDRDAKLS